LSWKPWSHVRILSLILLNVAYYVCNGCVVTLTVAFWNANFRISSDKQLPLSHQEGVLEKKAVKQNYVWSGLLIRFSQFIKESQDCLLNSRFQWLCFAQHWELAHAYLFYIENSTTQFKLQKKKIGHRSRFRENVDLPLRRRPVVMKIRHFLMRAC